MTKREVGARVFAVAAADAATVRFYGHGTYLGLQPEPYWDPDLAAGDDRTWREAATAQVLAQMQIPQREWICDGRPSGKDQYGQPMGDTRPAAERVEDLLDQISRSPCIELDSGARVWGYFCWWASADGFDGFVADRTVEVVPVPDPLPRSLKTTAAASAR